MNVGLDNFVFLSILVVLSKCIASDIGLVLGITILCLLRVNKVVSACHHKGNVFTIDIPCQNDTSTLTVTPGVWAVH